ncbi:DNA starvation/stationary phase protection protein [Vibrio sp. HDW18]|uniref:Dps family protein n=1 Tax=Vibrio sp. HDW18 TaxID=2714948 RepID=UPI0014076D5F|nr:Dps family protein [Vibrio sp. HDW18]QIL85563.1 DNA starvation/stationary phase protection protein [Vibrio sp. HDW18]
MTTNLIGLDSTQSQKLANTLNHLLANYQVFYMNTRGYHWNIQGKEFFELHVKFEEIYTDLQLKIDEVAERILTLGVRPMHSFSGYLKATQIKEHTDSLDGRSSMQGLVDGFSVLLHQQRDILEFASKSGDEGTAALMGDYIREQEKLMWMLNAWLK